MSKIKTEKVIQEERIRRVVLHCALPSGVMNLSYLHRAFVGNV